jgi:hypothetical protein
MSGLKSQSDLRPQSDLKPRSDPKLGARAAHVARGATLAVALLAGDAANAAATVEHLVVPPSSHSAAEFSKLLAGKVLVAKLTERSSAAFDQVAFYGRDGTAIVARPGAAARTVRWDMKTRHVADGTAYAFISTDGRRDGATLQYDESAGRIGFSDAYAGPYFSFAVVLDCWPAGVAVASQVQRCAPAEEAELRRRLADGSTVMRRLRAEARKDPVRWPAVAEGSFTTAAGSVFENSYGNVVSVTRVSGHKVEFRDRTGERFESYGMLFSPIPNVVGNPQAAAAVARLWPLKAGKAAQAWVYNGTWSWKLSWKVAAKEKIKVPAGTFEAWRIEQSESSLGGDYVARSETWYAPAIGWNVRYRSWVETPRSNDVDEWVLTTAVSTAGGKPENRQSAAALP